MKIEDLFSVEGKAAVVTGGSRGIGLMIAQGLVSNGVKVYISSRKGEVCDEVAAELSKTGECISAPGDLSTDEGIESLAAAVESGGESLNILVNNAGTAWGAPIEDTPPESFDKVLGLNVKAPFRLIQRFLPMLRKAGSAEDPARVINIGSIDGLRVPQLENWAYSAAKAGLHMLTRHLAHHLVDDHITVNAIAPGLFKSKMTGFLFDSVDDEATLGQGIPLGRIGRPEDMAGTVIYLSSKAGSFLTGAVIPVDGGSATANSGGGF